VTNRGVVHAIDAETGRTRWSTAVGSPRHPSSAPGANDAYVAAINGSNLSVLDEKNGKVIWQRQVRGAPGAGPVVSQRYVFVPMVNGTIESYQLEDHRRPPWVFQSHGRAVIQPIYTGANVAWPTDRGHLYVCEGNQNNIRYRLETNDSIVSRATQLPPNRLLVASTDGYVYCVHENSGAVQWRFSTGEPVVLSPIVFGDSVLVITDNDSMFRIAAEDGEEVWQVPRIRSFVAASGQRLYCVNSAGRLTAVDGTTGSRIGTLPTETLDMAYVNKETDRIFIGTRSGVIQCVREIGQRWPLIHVGLAEEEAPQKPVRKKAQPAEEEPMKADENPFGGGASENPFGGSSSDNPFGGSGGSDDNPFGGSGGSDDNPFGGSSGGGSSGGSDNPFGGDNPFGSDDGESADPFGEDPF
jgi:outer membrane protein assembly factor BamB